MRQHLRWADCRRQEPNITRASNSLPLSWSLRSTPKPIGHMHGNTVESRMPHVNKSRERKKCVCVCVCGCVWNAKSIQAEGRTARLYLLLFVFTESSGMACCRTKRTRSLLLSSFSALWAMWVCVCVCYYSALSRPGAEPIFLHISTMCFLRFALFSFLTAASGDVRLRTLIHSRRQWHSRKRAQK